jgi:hypothetical protein
VTLPRRSRPLAFPADGRCAYCRPAGSAPRTKIIIPDPARAAARARACERDNTYSRLAIFRVVVEGIERGEIALPEYGLPREQLAYVDALVHAERRRLASLEGA